MTVTEIEVYDTEKPADGETGERPVKARIRQRRGEESRSNAKQEIVTESNAEAITEAEVERLDTHATEVTVTGRSPAPSLWERAKQGAAWAVAVMILTAAGWVFYKLKKM